MYELSKFFINNMQKNTFIFFFITLFFISCNRNSRFDYEGVILVEPELLLIPYVLNDSFLFSWPKDAFIIDSPRSAAFAMPPQKTVDPFSAKPILNSTKMKSGITNAAQRGVLKTYDVFNLGLMDKSDAIFV